MKRKTQSTQGRSSSQWSLLVDKVKNNYRSLLLGLISFLVLAVLAVKLIPTAGNFITSQTAQEKVEIEKMQSDKQIQEAQKKQKEYIVQEGDNLWSIAEKVYGSGYNDADIAKANKLADANVIDVGQKLILPDVKAQTPTVGEITEEAASDARQPEATITTEKVSQDSIYVVKEGDFLWKIAESVYGDGYQWPKIAEANNLVAPNYIHKGNVLKIPRNTS